MKTYILLSLLLVSLFSAAQKKDKYAPLFKQAERQIADKEYSKAILTYKTISEQANKKSNAYSIATYNIGYTYLMLKDDSSARQVFQEMLQAKSKEFDSGGGKGTGIMQEPYALYKHYASLHMAEIGLREKKYQEVLYYMDLASSKYPYRHYCGNGYYASHLNNIEMKARAYMGLKDTIHALSLLMPEVIGKGLASNKSVVKLAVDILRAKYSPETLKEELDKAINQVKIIAEDKYEQTYVINFMGYEIAITKALFFMGNMTKEEYELPLEVKVKLLLKRSDFYQKLTEVTVK